MCFKCLIPGLMLKALTPNVNMISNKASDIHEVCIGSKVSPCFIFPFEKKLHISHEFCSLFSSAKEPQD